MAIPHFERGLVAITPNRSLLDATRDWEIRWINDYGIDQPGFVKYSASFNSAAILVLVSGFSVVARHSAI